MTQPRLSTMWLVVVAEVVRVVVGLVVGVERVHLSKVPSTYEAQAAARIPTVSSHSFSLERWNRLLLLSNWTLPAVPRLYCSMMLLKAARRAAPPLGCVDCR